jgi:myo-inositol-1-phosphate synthase
MSHKIAPAKGKLGILTPGIGAVATTFMAGVEAVKKGLGEPVGSLTQLGTVRLGKRTDNRVPKIKDFVPLAGLNQLVFGGWDIFEDNAYEAAVNARVLQPELLRKVKPNLQKIKPMKAVFDKNYVKRIDGPNVKTKGSLRDKAEELMVDMQTFKKSNGCDRLVMIWCGSTEVFHKPAKVHQTLESFEKGLAKNDPDIAPSQVYAYAALMSGVPFANGAPNLTHDIPALLGLARDRSLPVCGKDFKTGQTYMKTLLAPGLKARMLGCNGWFSTNILGNRDGEVLEDPGSFKTKEETKLSVLDQILQPTCTRSCTRISITPSASITTRPAATKRKAGTTSTSSAGSAIPCRSKSISSAGIRSSPPPSSSTSSSSSTSPTAPA